ncbi:hypothetical protein FA95DRAFT_957104 [Auriscalpium vulgare]|uniref:Uncharacterized protein n=1 Tax=Auriscalpium vulgare TaxID=40419 RepID=A0ACB8RZG2_9AGAM|nr:hypothetical protein FA95DRAFT_957104 [Auriscalpium vulgare]
MLLATISTFALWAGAAVARGLRKHADINRHLVHAEGNRQAAGFFKRLDNETARPLSSSSASTETYTTMSLFSSATIISASTAPKTNLYLETLRSTSTDRYHPPTSHTTAFTTIVSTELFLASYHSTATVTVTEPATSEPAVTEAFAAYAGQAQASTQQPVAEASRVSDSAPTTSDPAPATSSKDQAENLTAIQERPAPVATGSTAGFTQSSPPSQTSSAPISSNVPATTTSGQATSYAPPIGDTNSHLPRNIALIAGIVGTLIFLTVLLTICVFYTRRRSRQQTTQWHRHLFNGSLFDSRWPSTTPPPPRDSESHIPGDSERPGADPRNGGRALARQGSEGAPHALPIQDFPSRSEEEAPTPQGITSPPMRLKSDSLILSRPAPSTQSSFPGDSESHSRERAAVSLSSPPSMTRYTAGGSRRPSDVGGTPSAAGGNSAEGSASSRILDPSTTAAESALASISSPRLGADVPAASSATITEARHGAGERDSTSQRKGISRDVGVGLAL